MWLRRLFLILIGIGLCAGGLVFFASQAISGYRAGDMEAIAAGLFVGGLLGFAGISVIIAGLRWTSNRVASQDALKTVPTAGVNSDGESGD